MLLLLTGLTKDLTNSCYLKFMYSISKSSLDFDTQKPFSASGLGLTFKKLQNLLLS